MTVDDIKQAIAELPESERQSLSAWLNDLDYDDWDKQMASDFSAGGRGAAWVEEIRQRVAAGEALPFEEGRARAESERKRSRG